MLLATGRISPEVEWAAAGRALAGQRESADTFAVALRPGGATVSVIDGLGHGADAAAASKKARETIEANAALPILELFARVHAALAGTRGAVLTVASFDLAASRVTLAGVGDVEAVLHRSGSRARDGAVLVAGVLGDRMPKVRPNTFPFERGDVLVLATDGIKRAFTDEPVLLHTPEVVVERILDKHARERDDALVLVVKFAG